MNTAACVSLAPVIEPVITAGAELERLGDEIAELAVHLDAATGRLLDLIREFDARGGWGHGGHPWAAGVGDRGATNPGVGRGARRALSPSAGERRSRGNVPLRFRGNAWLYLRAKRPACVR